MKRLQALWRDERPAFPLWAPVMLGLGVQIYFWLPWEPSGWTYTLLLALPIMFGTAFWRALRAEPWIGAAVSLVVLGICIAGLRSALVAAPVLPASIDATVEGVVRGFSRTAGGRPRLLLDRLAIYGVESSATPARAQVSLLSERHLEGLAPGMRVSIFAKLGPPGAPVEPGGFDFRRDAWFKSIGAVGYARGAPATIAPDVEPGLLRRFGLGLAALRKTVADGLKARLPGETGAFAAAVTVGDRAAVGAESNEALRGANLAHLLAISGLHMGLLTVLVFGASRLVLAAIPYTARRWRTKRVAAAVALVAATGYLLISGASVATERAYVMALVAFVAVILGRRAVTLRALAVAALTILVIHPESLTHVGFQMSFAATAAIVAGFDFARERGWNARFAGGSPWRRALGYLIGLTATSLLAGLATAPFAAYHFNRVANYGLVANLVAVPAMGFWVAPSALLAALFAPFGLEGWALAAMGRGIEAIMAVARFVSGLPGATRGVPAAPGIVLTLIVLGGLGLCLGRRLFRWMGAAVALAGFVIWFAVDTRPEALAAAEGRLLGVMGPEGRALDSANRETYAARNWLERDGDGADRKEAAARKGFVRSYEGTTATLSNGWRVANVLGQRPAAAELARLCQNRVLIFAPSAKSAPGGGCIFLHGRSLAALGAISIDPDGEGLAIGTVLETEGRRPWTRYAADIEADTAGLRP